MTIQEVLSWIAKGKLILPSMQRNFVWSDKKICDLFDSLASGYPIGTFLFWEIDHDKTEHLRFNTFISEYDEGKPMQRGDREIAELPEYIAVLDGQQRITSLNIGINGCMRLRKKHSSKFVDKFLALNVFHDPNATQDEMTNHYEFKFVVAEELRKLPVENGEVNIADPYWVPVSQIADKSFNVVKFHEELVQEASDRGLALPSTIMTTVMSQTQEVFDCVNRVQAVSYFRSQTDDLSEVVDIFVRVNSGGQKLSSPDLMLAIAAAEIVEDPQEVINDAIELVSNATKSDSVFKADKDLILRAGLMFTGQKSVSLKKQENYSKEVIGAIFNDCWDEIIDSLENGVKLLEWLGFNVSNLSKNLLLPIAYYLYLKKPGKSYYTQTGGEAGVDHQLIKQWVIRSIVKNIFRDGTGSTLIYARNVIDSTSHDRFPLAEFLKEESQRDLRIGDESIDEIMNLSYGDAATKPVLSILAGRNDVSSIQVDHMWPQSVLASKKKSRERYPNITDEEFVRFKKKANNIANLQLLSSGDNLVKGDTSYDTWLFDIYGDAVPDTYYQETCVDPTAPTSFDSFLEFIDKRSKIMRARIAKEFGM